MPPMSEPLKLRRPKMQAADLDGKRFGGHADLREGAVAFQQQEVGVDVVLRGHGVENEMETVEMFLHLVFVFGIDDFIRAEPQGIFDFVRRGGEDHHVRAESLRQFHAHVTQSAESHHADFLAFADFVVAQRRISGDASAKQRGGGGEIQILRDVQHKGFIHDDAVGVAAVGHAAAVFVRGIVGEGRAVLAELFEVVLAVFAGAAGIHQATDGGDVAFLEFLDVRANFHDASDDFVAGHARVGGAMPFVAGDMHVRVADAAI